MTIDTSRHREVFDANENDVPVAIIGAGATGSHVFAELVKLGMHRVTVIDDDDVEQHNLANQIYTYSDVGHPKIDGCFRHVERKLGEVPPSYRFTHERVTADNANYVVPGNAIVFLLVDTMAARDELMTALRAMPFPPALIIETRMASTHGTVFALNPFDKVQIREWRKTLVSDDDEDSNEMSACGTSLTVGTTANFIACTAVWQMMQFFTNPDGMAAKIDLFCKPTMMFTEQAFGVAA